MFRIIIDGIPVTVRRCAHCGTGRFVFAGNRRAAHFQRLRTFRHGISYEISTLCPGRGKRAYGSVVRDTMPSAARLRAIRQAAHYNL